jgi:hypothetical protein
LRSEAVLQYFTALDSSITITCDLDSLTALLRSEAVLLYYPALALLGLNHLGDLDSLKMD